MEALSLMKCLLGKFQQLSIGRSRHAIFFGEKLPASVVKVPAAVLNPALIPLSLKGAVSWGFGIISKAQKCFWINRNSKIMV